MIDNLYCTDKKFQEMVKKAPDDYSEEERITEAPDTFAWVPVVGIVAGVAGAVFGFPFFF